MVKTPRDQILALRATRADRELVNALARLEQQTPSTLMRCLLTRAVKERLSELTAPQVAA